MTFDPDKMSFQYSDAMIEKLWYRARSPIATAPT